MTNHLILNEHFIKFLCNFTIHLFIFFPYLIVIMTTLTWIIVCVSEGSSLFDSMASGMRLIISCISSFLVLSLLLFMVHRLRQRRRERIDTLIGGNCEFIYIYMHTNFRQQHYTNKIHEQIEMFMIHHDTTPCACKSLWFSLNFGR